MNELPTVPRLPKPEIIYRLYVKEWRLVFTGTHLSGEGDAGADLCERKMENLLELFNREDIHVSQRSLTKRYGVFVRMWMIQTESPYLELLQSLKAISVTGAQHQIVAKYSEQDVTFQERQKAAFRPL